MSDASAAESSSEADDIASPKMAQTYSHLLLTPVHEEVGFLNLLLSSQRKSFTSIYFPFYVINKLQAKVRFGGAVSGCNDNCIPMVDKAVDACWNNPSSLQQHLASKGEQNH